MDLDWLGLIIPLAYYTISLFFLCFPNILHKKKQYPNETFNRLLNSNKLLCIGHRGGAFEGAQNTIELFHLTSKQLHMFELDVCLTKDGQLVVNHDSNLLRITGKNVDVSELNFQDIPPFKSQYQSFGGQSIKTNNPKIPLLDTLFQQFPQTLMNIELKTPSLESIAQFSRLVKKYKRQHITVWGAMRDEMNDKLRESCPQTINFYSAFEIFRIFLLCITGLLPFVCIRQGVIDIPLATSKFSQIILSFADNCCKKILVCILLAIIKFFNLVSRFFIPHLKKRGILTFYFILNDEEDFQTAISMGCSGIMTDVPKTLQRYLKKQELYYQRESDSF